MLDISWKSTLSVMLLINSPHPLLPEMKNLYPDSDSENRNNLNNCTSYHVRPILKILGRSQYVLAILIKLEMIIWYCEKALLYNDKFRCKFFCHYLGQMRWCHSKWPTRPHIFRDTAMVMKSDMLVWIITDSKWFSVDLPCQVCSNGININW